MIAGIAAVSAALLMTELALTRIFSVTMYYHFAFLAISIALFGLSASGVTVDLARQRLAGIDTRILLSIAALTHALATLVALACLVRIRVVIIAVGGIQLVGAAPFDVVDTKGHVGDRILFSKWNSFSRVAVYDRPHGDWSISPTFSGTRPASLFMDIDSAASTPIALAAIVAAALGAAVGLAPLIDIGIPWELPARIAFAIALVLPVGILLGMPLPGGMRLIAADRADIIPWGWGINGACSVVGVTLAVFIAMNWGFSVTLLSASVVYALAALTLRTR